MKLVTSQMIVVFTLIVISLVLYATDATPLEVTSLGVICGLLILFNLAPVPDANGVNQLGAVRICQESPTQPLSPSWRCS